MRSGGVGNVEAVDVNFTVGTRSRTAVRDPGAAVAGQGRASLGRAVACVSCLLCLGACTLAGCAVVRIESEGGDVRVERHWGVLAVNLAPTERSLLAETTALGVVKAWDGVTLGYYDSSLVALTPDDCRLVVWVEGSEQVAELRRLLGDRMDLCVYARGGAR
jgi:hypothetical protein